MSRPLRIQFPDAWYHVMNRGRRAEKIFHDKDDYQMFVDLLKETAEMWNIRVSAYCLLPNHYHLLIQTPEANISRSMRHLNGVYTQRYNSKHSCDGQLFRGRYKSILVSEDSYLLQVVRYIHRNPLKARLVKKLEDYPWSSHKAYLSVAKKWGWLHKKFILSMLTKKKSNWINTYRQFVKVEDDADIINVFEGKKRPSILGQEKFIDWVKSKYYHTDSVDEVPQVKDLAPDIDLIIKKVCKFYQISTDDLYKTQRGIPNEPRSVSIYLARITRRDSLKEISQSFGIKKYSSTSTIIERLKNRMKTDKKLHKKVDMLRNHI
ncbi:MAG: transposase, partial [Desulfobacterales bacterium]|nr:transposase [Desulfobacterales bacterium]